jgi:hypothetical protein
LWKGLKNFGFNLKWKVWIGKGLKKKKKKERDLLTFRPVRPIGLAARARPASSSRARWLVGPDRQAVSFLSLALSFPLPQRATVVSSVRASLLGNSGKPVTLETLSLTKFSKHVFQEQGIHDFRKPGTCEASNSWTCEVRESGFGKEMGSRTCGRPESRATDGPNFGGRPIRESVKGWVRESRARTSANQRRSEDQFGKLLKTQFGSFTRRHSRTGREAKSKLLSQKVRV